MSNGNKTGEQLFGSFPPVTTAEWEEAIRQDLKGGDYRTALKWDTGEGVEVLPFYRREDLENLPSPSPGPAGWNICQKIYAREPSEANRSALSAKKGGAGALQFSMRIHRTNGVLGDDLEGTAFQNQRHFKSILRDIPLEETHLLFDVGMAAPILLAMLENETVRQGIEPEKLTGSLLYDPYAFLVTNGYVPVDEQAFQSDMAEMVRFCRNRFRGIRCLGVDARCYHRAGATLVQEVALALAAASEYLATLTDRGIPARDVSESIFFSFSIGGNYFPEIARFRAVRLLWDRLLDAYKVDDNHRIPVSVHGETSRWNKTVYDPYTNLLRTTTEGMAAAIGNCDLLTVHPFDLAFRKPDDFSIRLARNSQHIFKEEAFLDKVRDPARGSYYIETLTDKIAAQSWELFREIEQQGGLLKALESGTVTTMVNKAAETKRRAVAGRSDVFVGTNRYPNTGEKMSGEIDAALGTASLLESGYKFDIDRKRLIESIAEALQNGACLGDIVPSLLKPGKQLFRALPHWRGSEAFEKLRLAIENHPSTPVVLLLPMGDPKIRRARSSFAGDFFAAGGYVINDNPGFDKMDKAMHEVRNLLPDVAVLCSSDREYPDLVPSLCDKLDALQKRPIFVLAGVHPESQEAERYIKAGVDLCIDRESNLLETLTLINKKLGIEYDAT